MHGDHYRAGPTLRPGCGSSPHARGPRCSQWDNPSNRRFIPACTGTTCHHEYVQLRYAVHPRMHGDHGAEPVDGAFNIGSSPHARGPRKSVSKSGEKSRFIPACTGTTSPAMQPDRTISVHPRMHGDHQYGHTALAAVFGSSPHARGPPRAYVRDRAPPGSSPHARGPPRGNDTNGMLARFIPACTGTTIRSRIVNPSQSVHPRMHGDHPPKVTIRASMLGSSPHARGPLSRPMSTGHTTRFIPACTGTTFSMGFSRSRRSVHPRMHGDHLLGGQIFQAIRGSSPHARGPHPDGETASSEIRFIPACTGTTMGRTG